MSLLRCLFVGLWLEVFKPLFNSISKSSSQTAYDCLLYHGPRLETKLDSSVETELEAPESSNRITGHAQLSGGTRSGVTIVL